MISVVGVIITVARVFVGYLLVGLQVLLQMISVVGVIITVLFCTVRRWGAAQPPGDRLRSFIYCQAVGGRPTPRCSASKFIVILLVPGKVLVFTGSLFCSRAAADTSRALL